MQYVVHRRFKHKCLCGNVNLPYGTECELQGGIITKGGRPLVAATSENAYQYFARNDDGHGLERGKLTQEILSTLRGWHDSRIPAENDKYDRAWERIWSDATLHKFKRHEYADYWLWNRAFFDAEISELQNILKVIKEA